MNDAASETAPHTIVTGGSSGIGAAVVDALVLAGHHVTIFDLQPATNPAVAFFSVDLSDEAAVQAACDAAARQHGRATGLVTCHGIRGEFVPAMDVDLERAKRVIDVHYIGTFIACREFFRRLDGTPGSIVTVNSTTTYGGWANQCDYGTAKAAVKQLTQNLAIEWASHHVRVNSVAPGFTLTPMVQGLIDDGYDMAPTLARTPMHRLASPAEMAGTIVFLLNDATFTTGQSLVVDGGWTVAGK